MDLATTQESLNKREETFYNHINRRSRLQTYCDVLQAISQGTSKPTRIMYQANLSWKILHEHLESLTRQELIVPFYEFGRTLYRLTPKGRSLLDRYFTIEHDLKTEEHSRF